MMTDHAFDNCRADLVGLGNFDQAINRVFVALDHSKERFRRSENLPQLVDDANYRLFAMFLQQFMSKIFDNSSVGLEPGRFSDKAFLL